jgi:hypothetical protein
LIAAGIVYNETRDPEPTGNEYWPSWCRRRRAFAALLLVELAHSYGCRFKTGSYDTSRMRLAGISISCTSGSLQMLRGWCRKARASARARS